MSIEAKHDRPPPTISSELRSLLRRVKLGKALDTLPERLASPVPVTDHTEFLELVLSDEVTRRDTHSADLRARTAGLGTGMRLELWDDTANLTYDRAIPDELVGLRFVEAANNALILGPVGVGKAFHRPRPHRYPPATQPNFRAIRPAVKRLKASRLELSHDAEIRKLIRADLLILDDLCLQALDATDLYELIVERHRQAATVATSDRHPPTPADLTQPPPAAIITTSPLEASGSGPITGGEVVPSRWQTASAARSSASSTPIRRAR